MQASRGLQGSDLMLFLELACGILRPLASEWLKMCVRRHGGWVVNWIMYRRDVKRQFVNVEATRRWSSKRTVLLS